MAEYLAVSRNTVDSAYQQLIAEGYIYSKVRKGLYVIELKNEFFLNRYKNTNTSLIENQRTKENEYTIKYDFKHGDIDLNYFPYKEWRKLTMQIFHSSQRDLLLYGDPKENFHYASLLQITFINQEVFNVQQNKL
ncbi:hypothetical protein AAAC51_17955 [Priestia megaterium]